MKPLTIASCLLTLLVGCTPGDPGAAPASGDAAAREPADAPGDEPAPGDPVPPEPPPILDPTAFTASISHRYLPLVPGTTWSYAGHEDGIPKREQARVLDDASVIFGVPCTAVEEQVFLAGVLVEMTTHYFAQDPEGNVWRFGEQSIEFGDGPPVIAEDSWEAGADGALPWIALSADPQAGDVFTDGGSDEATVLALDATAIVPAGTFADCLEVLETNAEDVEDRDRILYAPGVGLVSEESPSGRIDLVSFGR